MNEASQQTFGNYLPVTRLLTHFVETAVIERPSTRVTKNVTLAKGEQVFFGLLVLEVHPERSAEGGESKDELFSCFAVTNTNFLHI